MEDLFKGNLLAQTCLQGTVSKDSCKKTSVHGPVSEDLCKKSWVRDSGEGICVRGPRGPARTRLCNRPCVSKLG